MKILNIFFRSSHWRSSLRKGAFKNLAKYTGKHLLQSLFFNEVTGFKPTTLLKKRLWHRCFPVNFSKFLKTPFLKNTCFCFLNLPAVERSLLNQCNEIFQTSRSSKSKKDRMNLTKA